MERGRRVRPEGGAAPGDAIEAAVPARFAADGKGKNERGGVREGARRCADENRRKRQRASGPGSTEAMNRRVLSLVLLSLAASIVAPVACAQEPPARNATTAAEALRIGQYDDAIRMARADAARQPSEPAPVRIHADALRATGKYAEAEEVLNAFAVAHPNDASLWNRIGEVQKERGRLTEAAASF